MVTRTQTLLLFTVLSVMVLLGDGKQSVVLVIACAGTLGLYIYGLFSKKTLYCIQPKVLLFWILLLCSLIASSIFSVSLGYSITECIKYTLAFLLFVYFSNSSNHEFIKKFAAFFYVWSLGLIAVATVLEIIPGLESYIPRMNLLYRSFGHNHIIDVLLFTLPYSLSQLHKKRSFLHVMGFLYILLAFICSISRGGMLLMCLYLLYFLFTHIQRIPTWSKYFIIITVTVFYFLYVLLSTNISNLAFFSVTNSLYKKSTILESRAQYWKQAVGATILRPILGWGPGTFSLVSKRFQAQPNSYSWYAHSLPLQTIVEIGIPGALILFMLLLSITMGTLNYQRFLLKEDHIRSTLFQGIILTLIYSFIEMNMDFTVVWVLFWINIGSVFDVDNTQKYEYQRTTNTLLKITLIFICLYYISTVAGNTLLLLPNGIRSSFYAQPYDEQRTLAFLDTSKYKHNISHREETLILSLHSFNPSILVSFSKNQENTRTANKYTKEAIDADPQNTAMYIEFISNAIKNSQTDTINSIIEKSLLINMSVKQKNALHNLFLSTTPPANYFTNEMLDFIGHPDTKEELLSKITYFLGLKYVSNTPQNTLLLWTISRDASPSWGYFHVELASLQFHVFHNTQKSKEIIEECAKTKFAQYSCTNIQISEYFPGSQKIHIQALPFVY